MNCVKKIAPESRTETNTSEPKAKLAMSEGASPLNPRIKGGLVSPQILEELAGTPYACSSLEQLAGGTANYTFKGTLTSPLVDGTTEVAIKNSKPYSASSNTFPLDISRSVG